jgi:hypothetical protein
VVVLHALPIVLLVGVAAVVYGLALVLLRALDADEWRIIRNSLAR